MSEFHPNRVRPPRPRFTARRLLNFWPLLVWFAVLATAFWAFKKGVKFSRMNGIVDPIQEAISADDDARINKILVKPGQQVKKGEPIVELDTKVLDEQINKLQAAIKADLEDRILSYQLDMARLKGQLRDLKRDEASDSGELAAINRSISAIEDAEKKNPGYASAFAEAKARVIGDQARLAAVTRLYADQIKELKDDIAALEKPLNDLIASRNEPEKLASANGDLSELQELRQLRSRATLVSSHDGVVDRIEKDDGEFVLKGETIVRIVSPPEIIRGLLPQDQMGQVQVGMKVWVSSSHDRYKYYATEIIAISPRVNNVLDRTSANPNAVFHGQEVIAKYPTEATLHPGQTIVLHLEEPGEIPWVTRLLGQGNTNTTK